MENATTPLAPFLVPREPAPPARVQLGQPGCAVWAILSLVTGGFAWDLYRARHYSVHGLVYLVGDYCTAYYGLAMLYVCLRKHELLRGDADDPAAAAELRRVRLVLLALALYLGWSMTMGVLTGVPSMAPHLGVWVLAVLVLGLGLYFLVAAHCGGDARADDEAGRWPEPEEDLHDHDAVSPEQTV